tara:strand:- start:4451 stop:4774 length:324 start_codon:yes stop_codon:yes gene_type:complete
MLKDMATELGESTQVKANLAFVAKVIAIVGSVVWGYSVIWNKLNALDLEIMRLKHDVELNAEFRVKWPRGELGALPDDAEQNMRLMFLEKQIGKHDELLEAVRYGAR